MTIKSGVKAAQSKGGEDIALSQSTRAGGNAFEEGSFPLMMQINRCLENNISTNFDGRNLKSLRPKLIVRL